MPVFNDKQYLERSLKSILGQTHENFELMISDDGSTDGSEDICRRYASIDSRIQYFRQPVNIGVSRNMEFLLHRARGKYFMWAGNDDILEPGFISNLKSLLDDNDQVVLAFCPTIFIDDDDQYLSLITTDYSGRTAIERVRKLIYAFEDSCGYGLFVRKKIEGVQFPVWWSVNRTRAYNNIYPTLCYYLSAGNYVLSKGAPLFRKRIKFRNVNHRVPFPNSYVRGLVAFFLWKFNLVYFSLKQVYRGSHSWWNVIALTPEMIWNWFVRPSAQALTKMTSFLFKRRIRFYLL
jgi:glycosyltransferase involved in cell wall biosynthesis